MANKNYNDENKLTGAKALISTSIIDTINKVTKLGLSQMDSPAEKIVMLCGTCISGLSGAALILAPDEKLDELCEKVPSEIIIFGALYIIASVEDGGEGIICGYNISYVSKAMEMFKAIFNREYPHISHLILNAITDQNKVLPDVSDSMKKFLPH